jgi:hypothetical protein
MRHPTSPPQHRFRILGSQMRRQPRDTAEMQPAVGEHLKKDRMMAGRPCHGDAQVRFVLPQAEDPPAVLEHRRACSPSVQAPALRLRDVSHDVGLDPSRLLYETKELEQQLVVPNILQAQHRDSLGRDHA